MKTALCGLSIVWLLWCCGCAPQSGTVASGTPPWFESYRNAGAHDEANIKRLQALWDERTREARAGDYPVGPGDVLEISVPAIQELSGRHERVAADGTISLPMVGVVHAGGLSEEQLRQELVRRLDKYMYNPQVDVFVREYRSREVAVVGAVRAPGAVTLTSSSETILDVLTERGGMAGDAADEIVFIPGEDGSQRRAAGSIPSPVAAAAEELAPTDDVNQKDHQVRGGRVHRASGAEGRRLASEDAISLVPRDARPLFIPVRSTTLAAGGQFLDMPVRPGDVIVVPGGGQAMVLGWVEAPGSFAVGSGLTVLGAVGAAGGPMYAANLHDVKLIRTDKDGVKRIIRINLEKVAHGNEPDLPVHGNDVIEVPYSWLKIGPYIVYQILTRMGLGFVGLPLP
jgi:protein involved in polysaccharide export with SLBB domain